MPLEPGKAQTGEQSSNEPSSRASHEDNMEASGETVPKRIRQSTPSPHRGSPAQASPPRFVSVEELMDAAKGVTNLALAHEIVVNGGFQLKPMELPQGSLERAVRDIVHKAFWDSLEAQFSEDPPVYDHAIILLGEIKETLFSFLLPGHTRLRNQINEVLDLELIKQEAENGALDIPKLASFTIGMMGTLCAPARDEEIKKLRDIKEPVPLFRAIFAVLDLMKLDMANFAVSSIRPHLMQQSVEYERKKFQDFFEKQPNSLDYVTSWIQETANDLYSKDCAGASSGSPCPVSVLNHAYLKLLTWDHEQKPFPDTVVMDQIRFQEMKQELLQLTLLGTVLLITHNAAGPAVSSLLGFTEQMKSLIRLLLEGVGTPGVSTENALATLSEKICMEVARCLSQHGSTPFSPEREESLKGQIRTASSPSNQIYRLIESRIHSFLLSYLTSTNQRSSPALPGGLGPGPIQKELEELAVKLVRLVNYNKMVFSPYYDSILSKVLNEQDVRP